MPDAPELSSSADNSARSPLSSQSQRSLSPIDSISVSSISSSASSLSKREFSIPLMWKPNIMAAIDAKKLNPDIRNEIVRDLVTHMYGHVEKPSPGFINKVAKMLVEKYPFMSDSSDSSDSMPYVCGMFIRFLSLLPFKY